MAWRGMLAVMSTSGSLIRGLQLIVALVKIRWHCVNVLRDVKYYKHLLYWKTMRNLRLKCCNLNLQPPLYDHWNHWFLIYRGITLENKQEHKQHYSIFISALVELELHWTSLVPNPKGYFLASSETINFFVLIDLVT